MSAPLEDRPPSAVSSELLQHFDADNNDRPLRVARSFSRLESLDGQLDPLSSSLSRLGAQQPAAHESSDEDEDGNSLADALMPEGFDDLPPELVTLADRCVDIHQLSLAKTKRLPCGRVASSTR